MIAPAVIVSGGDRYKKWEALGRPPDRARATRNLFSVLMRQNTRCLSVCVSAMNDGTRPAELIDMKLGVKIPWDMSVL